MGISCYIPINKKRQNNNKQITKVDEIENSPPKHTIEACVYKR